MGEQRERDHDHNTNSECAHSETNCKKLIAQCGGASASLKSLAAGACTHSPVIVVSAVGVAAMDIRSIAADALFRACFTGCPLDSKTLLLDVRSAKVFKRKHILQVCCAYAR